MNNRPSHFQLIVSNKNHADGTSSAKLPGIGSDGPGRAVRTLFRAACGIGAAWLGFALIVNSAFGRADNGDYGRFMAAFVAKPYGFDKNWPPPEPTAQEDRFFQWWIPYWVPAQIDDAPFFGSSALFWWAGSALSRLLLGDAAVSLRMCGAAASVVLLATYLFALWSLRREGRTGAALVASAPLVLLTALVLSDVSYSSFVNSYFQESGSYVFLACALAAGVYACGDGVRFARLPVLAAAVFLFATARVQHGYVGVLLMVFIAAQAIRRRPAGRGAWAGFTVALILTGSAMPVSFLLNGHRHSRRNNAYHSMYFGILRYCRDPAAQLRAEGLPEESVALVGQPAYAEASAELLANYEIRLAHRSTLRIAAREPTALIGLLREAAAHAGNVELDYLGMRPKGAVDYRAIPSGIGVWSRVRKAILPRGDALLVLLAVVMAGCTAACIASRSERVRGWGLLTLLFAMISLLELCAAAVGDGLYEIDRHLFASNLSLDLALCVGVTLVLSLLLRPRIARD